MSVEAKAPNALAMLRQPLLLALLFLVTMCAGLVLRPDPVRASASPAQFDAQAARERAARILGGERPHPADSAEGDAVRTRLLTEIRALGFAPEVHEHFACRSFPDSPMECALVRNVLFSMGPQSGPAVLAASHYDSVPAGPGASDDGIGVAAWLEIASELADEPLQRRVIFLISDGEELGLLGAQAFAESDPLYQDVQAIVNLEARGTRGPATFFETNRPNADAVGAYGAGTERPLANSIMADVYRFLPNSTDISALTRPGVDVVNIAIIDGLENYHTPQDTLANQDLASLQHMGDQALGALRQFASRADAGSADNLVFTDLASRAMIFLPEQAGRIALGLCAAIALFFFWRSGKAGRWSALTAPIAAVLAGGALALGLGFGLAVLKPHYWFAHPEYTRAWIALLALLSATATLALLGRKASAATLMTAGAFWYALIGFGGSLVLPGLSILFLPQAALFAAGALVSLGWRPAIWTGAVAGALAALFMWAPMLTFFEVALGYDMPAVQGVLYTLMLLPWLGLLVLAGSWRISLPAVALATLAAIALAATAPAYSDARPQRLNIVHLIDMTERQARFVAGSADAPLPPAVAAAAEFAPALALPGDLKPSWTAPAPFVEAPAADAIIVSDVTLEGRRTVRLRLEPNGAYRISLRIPRAADPQSITINGETASPVLGPAESDYAYVGCSGRSCAGVEAEVVLGQPTAAAAWFVSGFYPGATTATEALVGARPRSATASQFGDGTATLRRIEMR